MIKFRYLGYVASLTLGAWFEPNLDQIDARQTKGQTDRKRYRQTDKDAKVASQS